MIDVIVVRRYAMHGSIDMCKRLASADTDEVRWQRSSSSPCCAVLCCERAISASSPHERRHCHLHQGGADVHAVEPSSGRSALHKAAFWGHTKVTHMLVSDMKLDVNAQDFNNDTALHDAARFGNVDVVKTLLAGGADKTLVNKEGQTPHATALEYGKPEVAAVLAA